MGDGSSKNKGGSNGVRNTMSDSLWAVGDRFSNLDAWGPRLEFSEGVMLCE